MKVKVKINSRQIFEDHKESEENISNGEITYSNKGALLEFTEKNKEFELNFKMSILEDKIVISRNGQPMVFDLKNRNNTSLDTPYGKINMIITTKKINVKKEENLIKEINLEYEIELEKGMKYNNFVDIKIFN